MIPDRHYLRFARHFSFLRNAFMKKIYQRQGIKLDAVLENDDPRFFHFKFANKYIPHESLDGIVNDKWLMVKCKNESLYGYTPADGDTIIDIGAGLGEETLIYSQLVGETGKVYSIEASPPVYKVLQRTVQLNHLQNVNIFQFAINDKDEMTALADTDASYESANVTPGQQGYMIQGLKMDSFLFAQSIERIDLLKSNIEGAEKFLVETISPAQWKTIRHVAIACHDFRFRKEHNAFFKTKDIVTKYLQENCFSISSRNTGIDYLDDWIYGTNKF